MGVRGLSQTLHETGEEHDRCVKRSGRFDMTITGCTCEYGKAMQVRVENFEITADSRAVNQDRPGLLQLYSRLWTGIFEIIRTWKSLDKLVRSPSIDGDCELTSRTRCLRSEVVHRVLLYLGGYFTGG